MVVHWIAQRATDFRSFFENALISFSRFVYLVEYLVLHSSGRFWSASRLPPSDRLILSANALVEWWLNINFVLFDGSASECVHYRDTLVALCAVLFKYQTTTVRQQPSILFGRTIYTVSTRLWPFAFGIIVIFRTFCTASPSGDKSVTSN